MARTPLVPQALVPAGAAITFATFDNVNGMNYSPRTGRFLRLTNTTAGPITVTVRSNDVINALTLPDRTMVVPATTGDISVAPIGSEALQADRTVWLDFSAGGAGTGIAVIDVNG